MRRTSVPGVEMFLQPYRVLDLTDAQGFLCGKLLADFGADVLKVEPPGGDPTRDFPPFYMGELDPERSLYWWAYNSNKRGITLDIERAEGRRILERLVASADILVESYPPGYLDQLGLGYHDLAKIRPELVMVSITPFGQTGPHAGYKSSDLIAMAMGGIMYISGDPDRAPVRVSYPQAYLHGGAEAAVGCMMAILERERSGLGQQVDTSIQESLISTAVASPVTWDITGEVLPRRGATRPRGAGRVAYRQLWSCQDGHVFFTRLYGVGMNAAMRSMAAWMEEEGAETGALKDMEWETFDFDAISQEQADEIFEPIQKFFSGKTKAELFDGALARRILIYPVSDMQDLLKDRQLQSRNVFQEVEHPELAASVIYPVEYLKTHPYPIEVRRRAPLIGEHNQEVYLQELGLSPAEFEALQRDRVI